MATFTTQEGADPDKKGWCIIRATYSVKAQLVGENAKYVIEAVWTSYCLDPEDDYKFSHIDIPVGESYTAGWWDSPGKPGVLHLELDDFDNGQEFVYEANRGANTVKPIWRQGGSRISGWDSALHDGTFDKFWFRGLCDCPPTEEDIAVTLTATKKAGSTHEGKPTLPSSAFIRVLAGDIVESSGLPACCS